MQKFLGRLHNIKISMTLTKIGSHAIVQRDNMLHDRGNLLRLFTCMAGTCCPDAVLDTQLCLQIIPELDVIDITFDELYAKLMTALIRMAYAFSCSPPKSTPFVILSLKTPPGMVPSGTSVLDQTLTKCFSRPGSTKTGAKWVLLALAAA